MRAVRASARRWSVRAAASMARPAALDGNSANETVSPTTAPRATSNTRSIADAIGVSYKTVANHCTQLKAKLGAARTADLIRIAISHGISHYFVILDVKDGERARPLLRATATAPFTDDDAPLPTNDR